MIPLRLLPCVAVIAVTAVAVGCGGAKRADPLAPDVYADHALTLMRGGAVYTPSGGWEQVTTEAKKMAAAAETPAETYPAIEYAVARLQAAGDLHAGFTYPASSGAEQGVAPVPNSASLPTVSLAGSRVGLVSLQSILESDPGKTRYVRTTLVRISSLQRRKHVCGWIVDLRGDRGGDMYPMLLAVGPILGTGRVIGFVDRRGSTQWVSYSDNTLSLAGTRERAPVAVSDFRPAPAVAVLHGPSTLSAGEAVAIAFRGRPHTRTFGATTGGATNSPSIYRLADGAELQFATEWDVDRTGRVYRQAISPDVTVTPDWNDLPVREAIQWLRSTPACR